MKLRAPRIVLTYYAWCLHQLSMRDTDRADVLVKEVQSLSEKVDKSNRGQREATEARISEIIARVRVLEQRSEARILRAKALLETSMARGAEARERQMGPGVPTAKRTQDVFMASNQMDVAELVSRVFRWRNPEKWDGINQDFREFASTVPEQRTPLHPASEDHYFARVYFAIVCCTYAEANLFECELQDDPGPYPWYTRKGRLRRGRLKELGFETAEPLEVEVLDAIKALRLDLGAGHLKASILTDGGEILDVDPAFWRSRRGFMGFHSGNVVHNIAFPGFSGRGSIRFVRDRVDAFFAAVGTSPATDPSRFDPVDGGGESEPHSLSAASVRSMPVRPSPFVDFMMEAARALDLDEGRPRDGTKVKVEAIREYLENNWKPSLGPMSAQKTKVMATLMRHPESAKGGFLVEEEG